MKIYIEPTHWKVLVEEGDKTIPHLSPPKEVTTIESGYVRNGVEHWEGPIIPVPIAPQVSIKFDAELHAYARSDHIRRHPLDLYSIMDTDSEQDEFEPPEKEEVAGPSRIVERKKSKLGLHQRKADGPKVWRVSGTGKFARANRNEINLNGLTKQKLNEQTFALQDLRRKWNRNTMLRPVLWNRESWGRHYAGDPTCRFEVDADNAVTTHYYDLSEIKMYKPNQWAISDEYGIIVNLDLQNHPERRRMNEAMDKMRSKWLLDEKLDPILERGFNRPAIEHLSNEGEEIANNGVEGKPEVVIYVCQDAFKANVDVFGYPIRSGACGNDSPKPSSSKRRKLTGVIDMDKTHYLSESDTDVSTIGRKKFDKKKAQYFTESDTDMNVTESESDQIDETFPTFPVLAVNMDLVHGNNNDESETESNHTITLSDSDENEDFVNRGVEREPSKPHRN